MYSLFYYANTHTLRILVDTSMYAHTHIVTTHTYIYTHTHFKVCMAAFCTIIITQQLDLNTCAPHRCSSLAKADPFGNWASALLED